MFYPGLQKFRSRAWTSLRRVFQSAMRAKRMDFLTVKHTITISSLVVAAKDQLSADLEGEAVILSLRSGTYYGLNAVGNRIWSLIQEPKTAAEVLDVILQEYIVEVAKCEREVLTLIQKLADEGLIEVKNEVVP
jgi:Coenzyme PQQ synthesis protein D (PqqD)